MKLAINKIAKYLDLPVNTVERWIRQGKIPVHRDGPDCIFKKSILKKWAVSRNLSFTLPKNSETKHPGIEMENLLPAIKRGGLIHNTKGDSVNTVLKAAVDKIGVLSPNAKEELYERLLERERLTSTGIGNGVAIPHPRTQMPAVKENASITTCFLEEPLDFNAVDDKPVFVMFILLSPSVKIHLHLLSRLAFCLRDESFVKFLRTTPDTDAFFERIAAFEKQIDKTDTF